MNKKINIKIALVSIFTSAIFFAGCNKSQQKNSTFFFQQAKHVDLPVPLGFEPTSQFTCDKDLTRKTVLQYQGDLSIEKSLTFCKKTMELNGWEIKDFSTKDEGLLFCNKANKNCALSLRLNKKRTHKNKTNLKIILQQYKNLLARKSESDMDIINKKQVNL
jgi:hypothetical protein